MVATGQVIPDAGDVAPHTHAESDVTGLGTALDGLESGKSNVGHAHAYADVTGKPATFAPSAHSHDWADVTGEPTEYPPSAHSHAQSDVTGLGAALGGKSDTGHTHAYADITAKPATFTPSAHSHVIGDTTNLQTTLDGKAASAHTHPYVEGGGIEPDDHGLLAWTMDPMLSPGVATLTAAQVLHVMKLRTRKPITVTNIVAVVTAVGVTLTANRCYAALYDAAGNLLSQTADQSAAWLSAGNKVMALAAPQQIPAGNFYVGLMYAGTTSPTFPRGSNVNTATVNMNVSGLALRSATVGAALTAPPASIVGMAGLFTSYCVGVS